MQVKDGYNTLDVALQIKVYIRQIAKKINVALKHQKYVKKEESQKYE